jgi:antitoxin CcdA
MGGGYGGELDLIKLTGLSDAMRDPALQRLFSQRGTMKRVAEGLGISMAAVSAWRRVPEARRRQVAAILGVAPDALEGSEPPAPGFAEGQAPFAEAAALGLDADAIAAEALREAIRTEKARRWLEENREAIEAWNRWAEENPLPLAEYRMF